MAAPNARTLRIGAEPRQQIPRPLGIFAAWRLEAYGYTLAASYAVFLFYLYRFGVWLLDRTGVPVYHDFTCLWVAGWLALHGKAVSIYDPAEFLRAQDALVGAGRALFSVWPYPPTYFLILAPLALLPYLASFLTWELATLLGCIAVVWRIVQRRPAIALVLASPFTVWNIHVGQSGFLTASLLGASLLFLERRPALAGVFLGYLTYKPQWAVLFPVALAAAKQWRAAASAGIATAVLVSVSIAAFGTGPWEALPHELLARAAINSSLPPGILNPRFDPANLWRYHQTIFGLVRALQGGASLAWLAQGLTTIGATIVVYIVWRSPVRYALKAATLSAAALIATPHAFGYDMTAIAIPVAFLAKDQIEGGLLRGEQTLLLAMFGFSLLCNLEPVPLQPVVVIALLCVILRRALRYGQQPAVFARGVPANRAGRS